jgi:hypothetical protein
LAELGTSNACGFEKRELPPPTTKKLVHALRYVSCNAVNVWRLLQAGQRRWRGLDTFRRRCSQQPFHNVLEDLVMGLLLKQPTAAAAVGAGAQVEDTREDFSDYRVPTRNIDRFFLSGPGRCMRLHRQGLHTAAPLHKNASTGNMMQRWCVVCDDVRALPDTALRQRQIVLDRLSSSGLRGPAARPEPA